MTRAASSETPLDASNIVRRLWIGGVPPFDRHLPEFDVLVLCARELQPESLAFRGTVIRCPIRDADPTELEHKTVLAAGRAVAKALVGGHRVLVTCAAGRNRSGLVTGLALGLVTRMSATEIIALIRARRRPDCLTNPAFQRVLTQAVGAGRAPGTPRQV
jgi:protein-tyrosine phosphatase